MRGAEYVDVLRATFSRHSVRCARRRDAPTCASQQAGDALKSRGSIRVAQSGARRQSTMAQWLVAPNRVVTVPRRRGDDDRAQSDDENEVSMWELI